MKKIIMCLSGFILTAGLIALIVWFGTNTEPKPTEPSGSATSPSQTTSLSASSVPTTVATQPPTDIHIETPMVSISLPVLVETDTADNGTVIFRRTFQDVVLSIPDADITKTITLDLLRRMDANSSTLSSIQDSAFSDYIGQEPWRAYYYEILYSPKRIDQTVLSLYGVEDVYSSTQSGYNGISVNYDLLTGSALTLNDILTEESTAADKLLTALLAVLAEKKDEYMLFDDYADIISNRFQTELQQENSWYFSAEGLCFFYSPYDIAPNSSGIVMATVPYSELTGILQDNYFPAEQAYFPGQLSADVFDSAALESYSFFSELITDPDAPRYVLHTEGVIYDLQVEQGQWIAGTRFEPEAVVYAANLLSPDEAFVLRAALPETQTSLRLSYRSGGSSFLFYLTLDSATGEILFASGE